MMCCKQAVAAAVAPSCKLLLLLQVVVVAVAGNQFRPPAHATQRQCLTGIQAALA